MCWSAPWLVSCRPPYTGSNPAPKYERATCGPRQGFLTCTKFEFPPFLQKNNEPDKGPWSSVWLASLGQSPERGRKPTGSGWIKPCPPANAKFSNFSAGSSCWNWAHPRWAGEALRMCRPCIHGLCGVVKPTSLIFIIHGTYICEAASTGCFQQSVKVTCQNCTQELLRHDRSFTLSRQPEVS